MKRAKKPKKKIARKPQATKKRKAATQLRRKVAGRTAKRPAARKGRASFGPRGRDRFLPTHIMLAHALEAVSSIDDLDLVDYAKEAAKKLRDTHPSVVFTSGRRNVKEQAEAMAGNVVQNRNWIKETYLQSAERDSLQKWVDDHPGATTKAQISAGLQGIMNGWTDEQKGRLSRHFSGQAFDVRPVAGQDGKAIKTTIRGLPNLRKFLESEGGLTIWHADFEK
jgi:hypothetical protein